MKTSKRKWPIFVFIGILTLGLLGLFIQRYLIRSQAAGEKVNVTITPASTTFPADQVQTLNAVVSTEGATNKISGLELYIKAAGNAVITDITTPTSSSPGTPSQLIKDIQPGVGHISYVYINSDADLPSSVSFQIKIKGSAGTGEITVDTTRSQIVGNISGNTYSFGVCTHGLYTFGGASSNPGINILLNPVQASKNVGDAFTVQMVISGQPAGNKVSGFDLNLTVDPATLEIVSVGDPIDNTTGGDATKFTKLKKDVNAAAGTIALSYVSILSSDQLPVNPRVDIQLRAKAAGTGSIHIGNSQVTGDIAQSAYQVTSQDGTYQVVGTGQPTSTPVPSTPTPTTGGGNPTATPTTPATVTPTPTVISGTGMTLSMRLKFQGILKQPSGTNAMKVQVIVGKTGFRSQSQYGDFTADSTGIWSGTVSFPDVDPDSGYSVYVKGPRHLSKRICDTQPIETAPATYRCATGGITLAAGSNNLDFSRVYLLAGDLPEQDGAQNGIVDAYDLSFIRLSLGKTDAKALSVADLNLDGIVDTQDYSLVIAALTTKYDEL